MFESDGFALNEKRVLVTSVIELDRPFLIEGPLNSLTFGLLADEEELLLGLISLIEV